MTRQGRSMFCKNRRGLQLWKAPFKAAWAATGVVLRHIEGLGNPEIAEIMDISVRAVESLTARGKGTGRCACRETRSFGI